MRFPFRTAATRPAHREITLLSGEECYSRALEWWHLLAVTLPLDALIVLLHIDILPAPEPGTLLLFSLLCAAAILVDRSRGLVFLTGMDGVRGWLAGGSSRRRAALVAAGVLLVTGEMILRIGTGGIAAAIFVLIAVAFALREIAKGMKQLERRHVELESSVAARIGSLNQRNLSLFLCQISAARLYSLAIALAAAPAGSWTLYGTGAAASLLALAALRPERDEFFAPCSQCGQPVSRPKGAGARFCPVCTERRVPRRGL